MSRTAFVALMLTAAIMAAILGALEITRPHTVSTMPAMPVDGSAPLLPPAVGIR
jgi:hypothetical protein